MIPRDVILVVSGALLGFGSLAMDEFFVRSVERAKTREKEEAYEEQLRRIQTQNETVTGQNTQLISQNKDLERQNDEQKMKLDQTLIESDKTKRLLEERIHPIVEASISMGSRVAQDFSEDTGSFRFDKDMRRYARVLGIERESEQVLSKGKKLQVGVAYQKIAAAVEVANGERIRSAFELGYILLLLGSWGDMIDSTPYLQAKDAEENIRNATLSNLQELGVESEVIDATTEFFVRWEERRPDDKRSQLCCFFYYLLQCIRMKGYADSPYFVRAKELVLRANEMKSNEFTLDLFEEAMEETAATNEEIASIRKAFMKDKRMRKRYVWSVESSNPLEGHRNWEEFNRHSAPKPHHNASENTSSAGY